jgi:hypothetical protein
MSCFHGRRNAAYGDIMFLRNVCTFLPNLHTVTYQKTVIFKSIRELFNTHHLSTDCYNYTDPRVSCDTFWLMAFKFACVYSRSERLKFKCSILQRVTTSVKQRWFVKILISLQLRAKIPIQRRPINTRERVLPRIRLLWN